MTYTLGVAVPEGPTVGAIDPALGLSVDDDAGKSLLSERRITAMTARIDGFEPRKDGRAVLCIAALGSEAFFRYSFRIDPDWRHGLKQDPDTFEPNDSAATAFPIELQSEVVAAIEDELDDDHDCYRFEVEADVTYTLGVAVDEGPTGAIDPALSVEVRGEDASTLVARKQLSDGQAGYYTFKAGSTQAAVLCLDTATSLALFAYRLRIDPDWAHELKQDDATFEPNNSAQTAYPIEANQELGSAIEQDIADHVDCYRFEVEREHVYTLALTVTEGPKGAVPPTVAIQVESESGSSLLGERRLSDAKGDEFSLRAVATESAALCLTASRPGLLFRYTFTLRD